MLMVSRMTHNPRLRSFSPTLSHSRQSSTLFHRISTDTLHSTHSRAFYYPIITTTHLFVYCATKSSLVNASLIRHSLCLIGLCPLPCKPPVIWCCLSVVLSAIPSSSSLHSAPAAQHCYRLESICYDAIDLCIHQFRRHRSLSSARVVPCGRSFVVLFIRFLVDATQFPRYLTPSA